MNQPTKKELLVRAMAPKSDQLNADDLIASPRTITITGVKVNASGEQLVSIFYENDNGKPWKPSKGMMRVLCRAWGDDPDQWNGKSATLYNDPEVRFGKDQTGGIRISHLSHISGTISMVVTLAKGKRKPYTVDPIKTRQAPPSQQKNEAAPVDYAAKLKAAALKGVAALKAESALVPEQFIDGLKDCYIESMQQAKRIDAEKSQTYNQVLQEQPPIPDDSLVPPQKDDIENF